MGYISVCVDIYFVIGHRGKLQTLTVFDYLRISEPKRLAQFLVVLIVIPSKLDIVWFL